MIPATNNFRSASFQIKISFPARVKNRPSTLPASLRLHTRFIPYPLDVPSRLHVRIFTYLLEPRAATTINITRVFLAIDPVILAHIISLSFCRPTIIQMRSVGIWLPVPT